MPHCLHLGLLSPRSVFGGASVRCTVFTAAEPSGTAATAGTAAVDLAAGRATEFVTVSVTAAAEVVVAVAVPVSELLLLRAGDGAAMKASFRFSFRKRKRPTKRKGFCLPPRPTKYSFKKKKRPTKYKPNRYNN